LKYFLDTNTCIYYLKGISAGIARRLLSLRPEDIRIPSMVKAELLYGVERSTKREENLQKIRQFLLPFEIVSFGNQEAERYAIVRAELDRAGTPIGPNDLVIAATTAENDGILVTNNEKEFKRVSGLKIENWMNDAAP